MSKAVMMGVMLMVCKEMTETVMETVITMLMIHDPKGNAISLPSLKVQNILLLMYIGRLLGHYVFMYYNTKYIQRANLI